MRSADGYFQLRSQGSIGDPCPAKTNGKKLRAKSFLWQTIKILNFL